MDPITEVASGADVVSPLIAWFRGRRNGSNKRFLVTSYGVSANQVRWHLTHKGITVWDVYVADDAIHFRIKDAQVGLAQAILSKAKWQHEILPDTRRR